MIRKFLFLASLFMVAGLLCISVGAATANPDPLSPVAVVADREGKHLFVAEYTGRRIALFDISEGTVTKTLPLDRSPSGLALSSDGRTLFVTGDSPDGVVFVVDVGRWEVSGSIPVGHSPTAPVASPDGKTLFVCNRFNNNVSAVDVPEGKEVGKIPVLREPVAAAVTPDGKWLVVANHLPAGPADGDTTSAVVSIIATVSREVVANVQLPNGSTGLRGVCVAPDGKFAYATHLLSRYHLPTTQLERGWMNTNALSIIDLEKQSLVNAVLLDTVDQGAANPWGIVCTEDGKTLCVAHAGTHEISVIDPAGLHAKIEEAENTPSTAYRATTAEDVPNDLAFLVGVRRKLRLKGNGPRGLAVVGSKAYAAEYFTDSIGVVDIDPEARPVAESIALGSGTPLSDERKGEMLFNDAQICFQHWQSCASCHPDGRADGLNWDLLNDGMGNPKNTKSLLLAHQTPPSMVSGIRGSAELAVRAGIRHILFTVQPEEDAVAIDAYLKSMQPVPSPHLVGGEMSDSAKRGASVFGKAGCEDCHPQPLFTDLKQYDVGVGKGNEKGKTFDTPTLVEVWRTAPCFYDGRAVTIDDILSREDSGENHRVAPQLTETELSDLVEFVLSQ